MTAPVQEDSWRTAGFKVLAQEPGGLLILFSDDTELKSFRERLAEYQKGTQGDAKNPAYNQLLAAIDDVQSVAATDRVGPRLRADGKTVVSDFEPRANFTLDIELWDTPTQLDRQVRVQKVVSYIEGKGSEILSRYVGTTGLIVLRARMRGSVLREIIELPVIARVDVPPIPDLGERDPPVIKLDELPGAPPAADAPLIGIIDSGSTEHPFDLVIPGCAPLGADPESSTTHCSGFRVRSLCSRPGMTVVDTPVIPIKSGTGSRA